MSTGIARQAGMAWLIDVAGAHAVAGLEFRGCRRRPLVAAAREGFRRVRRRECALHRFGRMERMTGRELVIADEAELQAQIRKAELPLLVIAAVEIDVRRQRFAGVPADIDVPQAEIAHGAVHGEDTAFPRRVEHRLIRLGLDLAETVHAAHVMDAVHGAAPGAWARPVPIIESRVTRVASFSSLQPAVPAGRIGTTR